MAGFRKLCPMMLVTDCTIMGLNWTESEFFFFKYSFYRDLMTCSSRKCYILKCYVTNLPIIKISLSGYSFKPSTRRLKGTV